MTSLWFLKRLHGDETYPLDFGNTSVGRDKKSSIETPSVYASRRHCTINVNEGNAINLTDCGTSNGTYINTNKLIKDTVKLYNNDQIGIGCSIDFDGGGQEIFVFILKKIVNNLLIEISDDEVDIKKEDDEDENKKEDDEYENNGEISSVYKVPELEEFVAVKEELPLVVPEVSVQEVLDSKNNDKISEIIIDSDSDSDNDFAYSQRINQEIKSELMDMDEIFHDNENDSNDDSKYINSDDDVILIDSDDDEVSKKGADKWFAILSQNSDNFLSIKKEPIEYESENENEIELKENINFPSTSCTVKLTDVLLEPLKNKSRKLKKKVRELLKSISSESSSEEDEILPAMEAIKKSDKNKYEETKKRQQSLCSPSSDENLSKKIKFTEEKPKQTIKTKIIHRSSSIENLTKKLKISSDDRSKPKLTRRKKRTSSSNEDEHPPSIEEIKKIDENIPKSHHTDVVPKTNTKIKGKPKIIDPPHLPAKRGFHRGISIDTSEKMLRRAKITSRRPTLTFSSDEFAAKHEKEKLVEARKTKLRELAEAEAVKKQLKQDETKVLNTPKVKLTKSNRGAFLTEDTIPKPLARNIIKNPTRSEMLLLPKIPRIKRKSECEASPIDLPVPEPVQEELFTIYVPKKSNLKKDFTTKTNKKRVRFDDTPQIKIYQIDDGNILSSKAILKDAPTTYTIQPSRNNEKNERKIKDPNLHRVQDVLTQVTEWPPAWFEEEFTTKNRASPPVNGTQHLLLPMVHEFKSFNDYEKILFPLMKLEMWSSIQSESITYKIWTESIIVKTKREIRGSGSVQRCVYDCTFKSKINFRIGSIVIVKFDHFTTPYCFLAYLSESKTIFENNNQIARQITIETSQKNFKEGLCIGKKFLFKTVGYIRPDLNSFIAVYDLKYSPLCKLILDPVRNFKHSPEEITIKPYRSKCFDKLNEAQEQILMNVYKKCIDKKMPSISLVEGPAGCGKSILITNLILQLIFGDEVYQPDKSLKILLCAPSNAAVDIITYKLSVIRQTMNKNKDRFRMIRYGMVEKMNPNVQNYSLNSLVERNLADDNCLSKEERVQMETEVLRLEDKLTALQTPESSNNVSRVQIDKLVNEIKQINDLLSNKSNGKGNGKKQKDAERVLLDKANIICTTLSSSTNLLLYNINAFDVCIVDEATQCTEPMSLIPLQYRISKLILVGDTQQLPATVTSPEAKANKFESSLFSRIQSCFSEHSLEIVQKLNVQYRMHPEICRFPNKYFYKNSLKTGLKLETFDSFPIKPYSVFSLIDFTQNFSDLNAGCSNINEADFVVCIINELFKTIPNPEQYSFAVITPYNKQKAEIEKKIFSLGTFPITVNTIDSYQGQEKDIVIISTARTKGVGFMSSSQRLNVAITRARKCLIICGNFISLQDTHIWGSLIKDATDRNLIYNVSKNDVQNGKKIMSCLKK